MNASSSRPGVCPRASGRLDNNGRRRRKSDPLDDRAQRPVLPREALGPHPQQLLHVQLTLLAVGGIALVVAVFAVLMSMSEGFAAALRTTGRAENAMVVQRGSASELTSVVPLADRNIPVRDRDVGPVFAAALPGLRALRQNQRRDGNQQNHLGGK